jgi:hypothetical protein
METIPKCMGFANTKMDRLVKTTLFLILVLAVILLITAFY